MGSNGVLLAWATLGAAGDAPAAAAGDAEAAPEGDAAREASTVATNGTVTLFSAVAAVAGAVDAIVDALLSRVEE